MILLGIFMAYGFIRTLYYVFWDAKNENCVWRASWILLSIVNLMGTLYFLGYKSYLIHLKNRYLELYYLFVCITIITFIYGGYLKNLEISDSTIRKEMNRELFLVVLALIIAILFNYA